MRPAIAALQTVEPGGREDAERFRGKDDENALWATAEHGAESNSVS